MLYETLSYTAPGALKGHHTPGSSENFRGCLTGKLMCNGVKRNEIAFMCICKTKELFIN
jgi:hypothetical protein